MTTREQLRQDQIKIWIIVFWLLISSSGIAMMLIIGFKNWFDVLRIIFLAGAFITMLIGIISTIVDIENLKKQLLLDELLNDEDNDSK